MVKRILQLLRLLRSALIIAVMTWILGEIVSYFWTPVEIPLWGLHQPDSLLGYRMQAHFKGRHRGPDFQVHVRTNSLGLRGPEIRPRNSSGKRILIIGDSFIFGQGMDENNTIPGQLQVCLDSIGRRDEEVINAGVVGYDNHQEIRYLEAEGVKFQPDIVIWAIYPGNDLADNLRNETVRSSSIEMRFGARNLLHQYSNFYSVLSFGYTKMRASLQARKAVRQRELQPADKLFFFTTEKQDLFDPYFQTVDSLMNRFASLAQNHHFTPLILLIPVRFQYDPAHQKMAQSAFSQFHFDYDLPTRVIHEMAQRYQIPFKDLLPDFRSYPRMSELVLPLDMHFSAIGYRFAAYCLFTYLQQFNSAPDTMKFESPQSLRPS